jgi:hypothetical protein
VLKYAELLLTVVKVGKEESTEYEIVARVLNLVGKMCKVPAALTNIA